MSPRIVADAASNVTPFRGQQANGGSSSRKSRQAAAGSRNKNRTNAERNVRTGDEIRFNFGVPRSMRGLTSLPARATRRVAGPSSHPDTRPQADSDTQDIPDYPPPSFEEAISTPPMSACASTTTLANTLLFTYAIPPIPALPTISPVAPSVGPPSVPAPERSSASPAPLESPNGDQQEIPVPAIAQRTPISENNSRTSLEIIDAAGDDFTDYRSCAMVPNSRHTPEARSPTPATSTSSINDTSAASQPAQGHVRGRPSGQVRPALDLTLDIAGPESAVVRSNSISAKRRHMSLSPLRTLFPSKSPFHGRTHSSPISPYSRSSPTERRSAPTLKTSFSTVSLGLLGSSVGEPSSVRHDLARLFSRKGKERTQESLDEWEIVESDSPSPTSLFSIIDPPKKSPITSDESPVTASTHMDAPAYDNERLERETSPEQASIANSYREEKIRAILSKPKLLRRNNALPLQTTVTPSAQVSPSSPVGQMLPPSASPPSDAGMNGMNLSRLNHSASSPTLPKRAGQVTVSSPLGGGSWRPVNSQGLSSMADLQLAIDTPLPESPTIRTSYFHHSPSTPSSPVVPRPQTASFPNSRASNIPWRSALGSRSTTQLSLESTISDVLPSDRSLNGRGLGRSATINAAPTVSFFDPPLTPYRRHYRGRPLPRPPPGTPSPIRVVDSVYASSQEDSYGTFGSFSDPSCPEGLLIDLDDDATQTESVFEMSRSQTPLADLADEPPSATSTATLTNLTSSRDGRGNWAGDLRETARPIYGEATELDVLVSGLDDDPQDGTDYDTLLLVSEFIGPATPTLLRGGGPVPFPLHGDSDSSVEFPLQGRIEVERRRTTKDGKQKVKLSLLGVDVNKCAICLSQFREGELADMGATCQHAFHANCLGQWRRGGKQTCPLCRAPFAAN